MLTYLAPGWAPPEMLQRQDRRVTARGGELKVIGEATLRIMLGAAAAKGQSWRSLQALSFVELVDLDSCIAAFFEASGTSDR